VPIDTGSVSADFITENDKRMHAENSVILKDTQKLADLKTGDYDAIFFAGGHGTCVDFPTDFVGDTISQAWAAGKVVAAVCHGPNAFLKAKAEDGSPLVKGRNIAVFTDKEEEMVGLTGKVPFLLETELVKLGGKLVAGEPWSDNAVADGRLVTGQNPQSSVSVAKLVCETLRSTLHTT